MSEVALVQSGEPAPVGSFPGSVGEIVRGEKTLGASHEEVGCFRGEDRRCQDTAVGDRPISRVLVSEYSGDHRDLFRRGEWLGAITIRCALQKSKGKTVKGRGVHGHARSTQGRFDTSPQVGRGPSGETQHDDLISSGVTIAHQVLCPADQELGLSRSRPRHDDLVTVYVMDGMVPCTRLDSNLPYVHVTIVGLGGSGERGLGLRNQPGFDAVCV